MRLYHAIPHDTLFFRDARPMTPDAGSGGHGARWPEPSLIFDALHAALHRAFPEGLSKTSNAAGHSWQYRHRTGRSSNRDASRPRSQRFGSLVSAGFFPALGGPATPRWLFPIPADVTLAKEGQECDTLAPINEDAAQTCDLPVPLKYALGNSSRPSKERLPQWGSRDAWKSYLTRASLPEGSLYSNESLFSEEWITGIGMDPNTETQDGERIYSAEYLRLLPNVGLGFAATLPDSSGNLDDNHLDKLFEEGETIMVGGQRRACSVARLEGTSLASLLPVASAVHGRQVKWVLLTHAVFPAIHDKNAAGAQKYDSDGRPLSAHPGGWLPNWVRLNGTFEGDRFVPLPDPEKRNGSVELLDGIGLAKAKRRRLAAGKPISARLVAARIPKPVPLTGWKERLHMVGQADQGQGQTSPGPSSTLLAVPAGAVYYFEAETESDAARLANILNWHGRSDAPDFGRTIKNRRSTLLGEKGFGLGVCGTWDFFPEAAEHL